MKGVQNPIARTLAVVALIASLIALIVVIGGATGGDSGGGGAGGGPRHAKSGLPKKKPSKQPKDTYVVRPGDSLSTIADQSGVSVEQLTLLNPNLDPQALISGQCVVLRQSGKDKCK
jgi:LysM repeat protein